jgi:hypothetical protein
MRTNDPYVHSKNEEYMMVIDTKAGARNCMYDWPSIDCVISAPKPAHSGEIEDRFEQGREKVHLEGFHEDVKVSPPDLPHPIG